VKAPYPGFIEPELATGVGYPPERVGLTRSSSMATVSNDDIKVFTRRGNDGTTRASPPTGRLGTISIGIVDRGLPGVSLL
jgi:hypothetical protein